MTKIEATVVIELAADATEEGLNFVKEFLKERDILKSLVKIEVLE